MLLIVSASPFVLLLFLSVLFPIQGQNIEETCTVNSSSQGICKILEDCPVVYNELLSGKTPENICGFLDFSPIVCCPTSDQTTIIIRPSTQQSMTIDRIITTNRNEVQPSIKLLDKSIGAVARLKCAENAQAVYGFELPPTATIEQIPVNVSRCALKTRKLIESGNKADPKEFPHMTAVGFDGENDIRWLCGGTLISAKIVLTAAHCSYEWHWGAAKWARVGDLNLVETNDDARPQTLKIIQRIRHPNYKITSKYHDIAILKLEREVTFDAWVRPACLPVDLPDVGTDNKAVATGWGKVDWYDDEGSNHLQKVTLNLVPQRSCNKTYWMHLSQNSRTRLAMGIVNDWQICAGQFEKGTCQGDSGGPLAVFNTVHECMYNVIGVTSFGISCGGGTPDVYTRVYHYIPWIERTSWPEYFQ